MFWFGSGWLSEGVPPLDFAGSVACLDWSVGQSDKGATTQWCERWFCGGPTNALAAHFLWLASYTVFTGALDPLAAVKFGSLFYFSVGAIGTYIFIRMLVGNRIAAAVGGASFALHPIVISMAVSGGHANFPPLYAAMPFSFIAGLVFARRPTVTTLLWFAGAVSAMLWTDIERGAIFAMFAAVFALLVRVYIVRRTAGRPAAGKIAAFCGSLLVLGALVAWATAGFAWPLYTGSKGFALFSEDERSSSVAFFSLNNPLFLIDRAGGLLRKTRPALPDILTYNSSYLYLGTASLLFMAGAVALARKRWQRLLAGWFAAALACSIWISAGDRSIYDGIKASLDAILKRAPEALLWNPLAAVQAGLAVLAGACVWIYLRRRHKHRQGVRGALLAYAVPLAIVSFLFLKPFWLLGKVIFIFGHMRSPTWFMSCMPPLGMACGTAMFLAVLHGRLRRPLWRFAATAAVAAAVLADYYPYRREYHLYYRPDVWSAGQQISSFFANEAKEGRILAASSYSPMTDLIIAEAGRKNAWGWLNWTAPAAAKEYIMGQVYTKLKDDQASAAALAGVANVRYVLSYLPDDGFESRTPCLRKMAAIEKFAIYENTRWRPFLQLYECKQAEWKPGGKAVPPLAQEGSAQIQEYRAGEIRAKVVAAQPVLLVVSENYHSGWRCTLDSQATALQPFGGTFLSCTVPGGTHEVTFKYQNPRSFRAAYAVSGSFVAVLLAASFMTVRARGRRSRAPGTTAEGINADEQ